MKKFMLCIVLLLWGATNMFATGAMFVKDLRGGNYQVTPIRFYDAVTTIEDQVATTKIDQTFRNTLSMTAEATCIFPLPEGAVITELAYWMNGVRYIGSVKEKQAAQKAYNDKIRQLLDPALLQYAGDNIFKLNIAPINANTDVRFEITYTELLKYEFGKVQFTFLLNSTSVSSKPLERVSLRINASTQRGFRSVVSPSHANFTAHRIEKLSDSQYTLTFGDENYLPTSDYRLELETIRDGVDMNVLGYVGDVKDSLGDGFFAAWITPPDNLNATYAVPQSTVFTADISSSMDGKRIAQLKQALHVFLNSLTPRDKFNIIVFSTNIVSMENNLIDATETNIEKARVFVDKLVALGLTNIDEGLQRSLAMTFPDSTSNSIVFLTDGIPSWGEIDSTKILAKVKAQNTKGIRIFSFGIGEELNKYLLSNLSAQNNGYTAYIKSDDSISVVIANHFKKISLPALQSPTINYSTLQTYDVYPVVLPDLFFGMQVLQLGRYRNGGTHSLTLTGQIRGNTITQTKDVFFPVATGGNKSVSRLWAQAKIDELLHQISLYGERKELVDQIISISIRFGILTKYTALYADPDDKSTDVEDEQFTTSNNHIVSSHASPNPSSGAVRFTFELREEQLVKVRVYSIHGECIATLCESSFQSGKHSVEWNGKDNRGFNVPNGLYLIKLDCANSTVTHKVLLMK